ncbi:MAG: YfbU family protein [Gammaproteobacteria bacterium]|nr:YfbU family protein [Gammaproteobacteria bacterium]MBU1477729.1 YfbU family protein [Gammaproteobacteria bacterium]MBU2001060.1 YfbU family protein [Gammaproteobacteria bacterium]MBU2132382.1 YfbU family protein [Gammaproteobacteria bacterium]MBU2189477.1 YfbU family protein [Gammaproteobacteria bacterium]
MQDSKIEMTDIERLSFINQFLILEKLYPEEADYYENNRIALQQGYKLHYKTIFENLWDEMSEDETKEVLDILEMHRAIIWSYADLSENTDIGSKYFFRGFDGNEESAQLSYCHYFIVNLDRYQELIKNKEYPDFNSHCNMLPKYRRMLAVWKAEKKIYDLMLSLAQIEKIWSA